MPPNQEMMPATTQGSTKVNVKLNTKEKKDQEREGGEKCPHPPKIFAKWRDSDEGGTIRDAQEAIKTPVTEIEPLKDSKELLKR